MKTMQRLFPSFLICALFAGRPLSRAEDSTSEGMRFATSTIRLEGESTGGVLTLMRVPASNYPYVAVTNRTGESSASVLQRLADELSDCAPCDVYYRKAIVETGTNSLRLLGGGLKQFPGWILGGTDKGLSIPAAPTALSVSYETNRVVLRWVNGSTYDSVGVFIDSTPLGGVWPGTSTQIVYDKGHTAYAFIRSLARDGDFKVMIVGTKDGTPSNGTGVRVRNHTRQESLMNTPFSHGIAPGFQRWSYNTPLGIPKCEQGNLPGMAPATDVRSFQGKGFYQIIKGHGTFHGGLSRRFLGLESGHTYRVGARLNTLDAGPGDWTFTFHAAANPANGEVLTADQLAGEVALTDDGTGPTAGQIARYEGANTTEGQWVERRSGEAADDNLRGDITLPAGSDSITIWFRLTGREANEVAVGLDSVTLEDLGKGP